jgi:hypothetical protein
MDASTISATSFTLTGPSGAVTATVAYNSATNTATLSPSAALANNTTYTANLTTAIKAADGVSLAGAVSWTFTTVNGAPTVTTRTPAPGATGTAIGVAPTATFSRAMDATTIGATSFTLTGPSGAVTATVSYNTATNTATLTPSAALAETTTYTATLTTAIKAADGVALASAVSWSFTTADVTAPNTTITSNPTDPTTSTSASFAFSSTETGSTYACSLDGVPFGTCTSPTSYSSLATGSHTFQVKATDGAGNTDATPASYTWTINPADTTPPDTTISGGPSGFTSSTSASITFASTETGSTFTCSLDAGTASTCTSPATYNTLADGSHTVTVTATDAAGNADPTPATRTWTVDTVAPNTTLISTPTNPTTSTSASFTFTSSETPTAHECRIDGAAFATCSSPKDYTGLVAGSHTFDVRAVDAAGNADATPATYAWTINSAAAAPTVTAKSPAAGATGIAVSAKPTATFSRAMDPTTITSSSVTLTPNGGVPVAASVSYDSATLIATLTPATPLAYSTTYTVKLDSTVKAQDGVALASSVTWSFTTIASTAAPTVTSAYPADGAGGVSTGIKPSVTFSKPMDAASFTTASFTIKRPDGTQVTALPSYNSATMTATLAPNTPLDFSKTFTVALTTAVKDTTGALLAAPYSWKFTTTGTTDPIRLNAGGPAYTGSGVSWLADAYFIGGTTTSTTNSIAGTTDPALYQTQRVGSWRYNVPVPNGTYDVKLYFAETVYTASGKRSFGVDVIDTLGATADITGLDVFAQVGANAALVKTIPNVAVTDGTVSLRGVIGVDSPVINAVMVLPVSPTVTSSTPASGATGVARSTTVTGTFSRAMDASSLTTGSFTLKSPAGVAVPATVSYNATTKVATLTPGSALAANTVYTARFEATVRGADGMTLASPVSWNFTTGP